MTLTILLLVLALALFVVAALVPDPWRGRLIAAGLAALTASLLTPAIHAA